MHGITPSMSISVSAESAPVPTPEEAFSTVFVLGNLYINDVNTATYGTDIVIPPTIGGEVVYGIYLHAMCLTSLDVSFATELVKLNCIENNLTSLDVSNNTKLDDLFCSRNPLNNLDVSKNVNLKYLGCSNNMLTALDVSKNTDLDSLDCYNNQLKELNLKHNTKLIELRCRNNQISSLDISQLPDLAIIECQSNKLTSLDISNNTSLYYLNCDNNYILDTTYLLAWAASHSVTIGPQNTITPVDEISLDNTSMLEGETLELNALVNPEDATYKDIVWSIKDDGGTGASITGNILSAESAGTIILTATISYGNIDATDYTQDFTITVNSKPKVSTPTKPEIKPEENPKTNSENALIFVTACLMLVGAVVFIYKKKSHK